MDLLCANRASMVSTYQLSMVVVRPVEMDVFIVNRVESVRFIVYRVGPEVLGYAELVELNFVDASVVSVGFTVSGQPKPHRKFDIPDKGRGMLDPSAMLMCHCFTADKNGVVYVIAV